MSSDEDRVVQNEAVSVVGEEFSSEEESTSEEESSEDDESSEEEEGSAEDETCDMEEVGHKQNGASQEEKKYFCLFVCLS